MNGEGSTGQNARECLADQRNRELYESAHTTFFVSYLQHSLIYLQRPLFWESLSIPYIPLILGQNIRIPIILVVRTLITPVTMMTSLSVICLGIRQLKYIFLGRFIFQIEITRK